MLSEKISRSPLPSAPPPRPVAVALDGRPLRRYDARLTNLGLEVTAPAQAGAQHTLTVTAAS